MVCKVCGTENEMEARFCKYCSAELTAEQPQIQQPSYPYYSAEYQNVPDMQYYQEPYAPVPEKPRGKGAAIASMCMAITSASIFLFPILCWFTIPLAIAGLITGCIGRKYGMGKAGIIISAIMISFYAVFVLLVLVLGVGSSIFSVLSFI